MSTVERPDGTTLAVETLGRDDDPVLLLIGGTGWSRDWWDDGFCARLVAAGLRVVGHDQRDTGESTHWPPGAPGYTAADLLADAVAVLDALGVGRAHVVGLSAGGGLAQQLALTAPERVAGLVLIATTAVDPRVGALPRATPEPAALFADPGPDTPRTTRPPPSSRSSRASVPSPGPTRSTRRG